VDLPYLSVALFIPGVAVLALLVMLIVSMNISRRKRNARRHAQRTRWRTTRPSSESKARHNN
jgi:hypothetical protein